MPIAKAPASAATLVDVLKTELRSAGMPYRELAKRLKMSESNVKRMFSIGDMTLSRVEEICLAIGIHPHDVYLQVTQRRPAVDTLTLAQEKALIADLRLLLVAICCIGQWSAQQIVDAYQISEAECIKLMVKLDKLGLIELKPGDRYRMRVSQTFHWRADGPVRTFLRQVVFPDYFSGTFDANGEVIFCVPAQITSASATEMVDKIRRLCGELARLHSDDQRVQKSETDGYTLVVGFRSWELAAFEKMRRRQHA